MSKMSVMYANKWYWNLSVSCQVTHTKIRYCSPVFKKKFTLKWYYAKNRISPIKAILKQKQVLCKIGEMLFTFLKYLFLFKR